MNLIKEQSQDWVALHTIGAELERRRVIIFGLPMPKNNAEDLVRDVNEFKRLKNM